MLNGFILNMFFFAICVYFDGLKIHLLDYIIRSIEFARVFAIELQCHLQ